jgi:hypothetical protein
MKKIIKMNKDSFVVSIGRRMNLVGVDEYQTVLDGQWLRSQYVFLRGDQIN